MSYPTNPYPQDPQQPYPGGQPATRPESVVNAIRLIWVQIAFAVISTIISFVLIDDIIDTSMSGSSEDRDVVRTGVIVALVIGLIIGVGLTALWAYFINKGANWARIVYTVLGVLGILFGLLGIGSQPGIIVVVQIISILITAAVIFLLFRPESNAFFKR